VSVLDFLPGTKHVMTLFDEAAISKRAETMPFGTQLRDKTQAALSRRINPIVSWLQKNLGETPQCPEFYFYQTARQESTPAEHHQDLNPEGF
jgi:hypothetical protein